MTSSATYYRGIDVDRNRSTVDIRLRQELISDLFWEVSTYHTYDDSPPEGASKQDYGVVTSLGVKF